jgi:hypothetical protein
MDSSQIPGYIAIALVIAREIFNAINHLKIKSKCGEKEMTASLHIDKEPTPQSPV